MLAGVYARISLDQEGERLGVQRQIEDCAAKAKALAWTVAGTYVDNDVSASKDVLRPEYARMLDDLRAGTIAAVVVYDLDRLTRKPAELEAFIDLADQHGIGLANVSGDVDLTTASGRMVARIKGAVARQEAERIGERVKRQKQQRLASGMPPGSRYRTFGYTRGWQPIDEERAIVVDVFERVAAGESVNSITNDLCARGIETVSGRPWRFQATTRMLESPIYAGLLSYKGKVTGPSSVPAFISEALYNSAQGRASKPAWNTRRHLLSGIAACDACKTPMNYSSGAYVCARILGGCGNIKIKASWLDAVVNAYMSQVVTWLRERPVKEEEAMSDPVADYDRKIEEARAANLAGDLDLADLLPMLKELRARRAVAVKEAAKRVEQETTPLEDYDNADLSRKRTEIRKEIQAIMVGPARRGLNQFDEGRFYVLMADGRVFPGSAINTIDVRNPEDTSRFPLGSD